MKSNIRDALEDRLSVNSYLWPKNIDPYEFIEAILKAGIKNIGLHADFIEEYGVAQISMNLTNIKETPIHIVFDEVCKKAQDRGLRVTGSELVGLIPLQSQQTAKI